MDIKKSIREFFMEELSDNGFHENVHDDQSLIQAGIMDSLSILKMISFIDEKFGIIPTEDELDPENFDTINHIQKFIQEKLAV